MIVYVYRITHISSNRHYVGSTINFTNRCYTHRYELNKGTHSSRRLQNLWNKHGLTAFEFVVLEIKDCRNYLDRSVFEATWVEKLGTLNSRIVENSHFVSSEESRKRASISLSKRWSEPALRAKASQSANKRWSDPKERLKQKTATKLSTNRPEVKAKMSASAKKRFSDPEQRKWVKDNMAKALKTKNEMIRLRKEQEYANGKRRHSAETRAKMSQTAKARNAISRLKGVEYHGKQSASSS